MVSYGAYSTCTLTIISQFYYQISEVILEKGTAVIASYKRQQESTSSQGRIAGMDMSLILL